MLKSLSLKVLSYAIFVSDLSILNLWIWILLLIHNKASSLCPLPLKLIYTILRRDVIWTDGQFQEAGQWLMLGGLDGLMVVTMSGWWQVTRCLVISLPRGHMVSRPPVITCQLPRPMCNKRGVAGHWISRVNQLTPGQTVAGVSQVIRADSGQQKGHH